MEGWGGRESRPVECQKNGRLFGMEPSCSKKLDFGRPDTLLDTNKPVYEI
jgi:hypothetical protein